MPTPNPLGRLPVFPEKNQRRVVTCDLHPVQEPRMQAEIPALFN